MPPAEAKAGHFVKIVRDGAAARGRTDGKAPQFREFDQ
jgi:hypothetical protein